ncbi:lysylphosphatidylglycerol synthase transmembrane domain-containing protein [Palaeococcus sp. (in: euryarchaeotes)]|nr:MAG: ABC transporter [Thermococci archaeon]
MNEKIKKLFTLFAFSISVLYLYKQIDFEELKLALRQASPLYLSLALILALLTVLLSCFRWYIFLNEVQKTSFKKTFKAYLSGYYLISILPPTLGHIAKVRLVGGDYFRALSSLAMSTVAEVILVIGLTLIFIGFTKVGVVLLLLTLLILIYEKGIYTLIDSILKAIEHPKLEKLTSSLRNYSERLYSGWREAKENKIVFALSFLLSAITLILQILGIIVVGRAFGLSISLTAALKGFIISTIFASISGIPAGVGANEFGLVLGIGSSTKAAISAFSYKFIFQYMWAIVGAMVFYKILGGGYEDSSGE